MSVVITGVQAVQNPPVRVYLGLSMRAAENVARALSVQPKSRSSNDVMNSIDAGLVYPVFLT